VNRTLRLVLLKEIPENADLRQQWNVLVHSVDRPQVFYTYEWSLAVQRAYHSTLHPWLFLCYDEAESLCGVVALAANVDGSSVSFLCASTSDYCDFLGLKEQKPAFIAGVLAELKKQDICNVTLTNLPAESDTIALIRQASAKNGYYCFARPAYVCAQVSLSQLERRPDDNRPVLPGKKVQRRLLNAIGRETLVRIDHARTWDAVEPILPQFMQCHVARSLVTGRLSNLTRKKRRVFLEELAKLLSKSGWLMLTRMLAGNNTVAWNYGFQFQDTLFWYQPTFDNDLEKYSPGICLLSKLIEEAAENPALNTVDLGLGAEEYKDRFANRNRETLYVTLRTSVAQYAREILRYRAAQCIKTFPGLEAMTRAWVALSQQVKEGVRRDGVTAVLRRLARRMRALLWSQTEVLFFEWDGTSLPDPDTARLQLLDLNQLASAALQHGDDKITLEYLLRSASQLQEGSGEGFGLVDTGGAFLHFVWVTAFDGFFLPELNAKVDAPSPDCVMLFDCWTPASASGHGSYGQAVGLIARLMQQRGKRPWIFSAESNAPSVRDLEKAGFQPRYSLVRRRSLGWQKISGKAPGLDEARAEEVPARVQ
jgi:hypothetical protein